jgi:ATP/maltotriose-dependent transcriptional regulator MalT
MLPAQIGPALDSACDRVRAGRLTEGMEQLLAMHDRRGDELDDGERAVLLSTLIECRLARGDLAEAMTLGDELTPLLDGTGLPAALAHLAKGELAAALSDSEAAVHHFTTAGELAPDASVEVLPWRTGASLAHLRNRNGRAAADLARDQVELARTSGSPTALASALRTLAAVDAGPDRVQHLLRARGVLAGTVADRLAAQIDTDLAGLLLLTHAPDAEARAVELLRAAEEHAGRQELWPLHARVRRLLDRVGEPPRKVQSEAMAALTTSERRVAQMAAGGLTNRQIANELVVTVKAVEWHLSHVYRKLGISSRGGLADTLGAPVA